MVAVTGSSSLPKNYLDVIRNRLSELAKDKDIEFILDAGSPSGADKYARMLADYFMAKSISSGFTSHLRVMRRLDMMSMTNLAAAFRDCGYEVFVEAWGPWGWSATRQLANRTQQHGLDFLAHSTGDDGK